MTKHEIKHRILEYLKSHNIPYNEDVDSSARLTMLYKGYSNCPDKVIESCIWFFDDEMEVRVYYSQTAACWCKESNYLGEFMHLLNFINARVWPCTADGMEGALYEPHHLHTPRLYITKDDCYDITLTTVINYDFYEVAPLETEDYITACCPELLDKLSPAIFSLLLGKINLEQSISYVKKNILEEG